MRHNIFLLYGRYEMAADPEEAAEAAAAGRQARKPALVPRFHVLLTTFELASKVRVQHQSQQMPVRSAHCCRPWLRMREVYDFHLAGHLQ